MLYYNIWTAGLLPGSDGWGVTGVNWLRTKAKRLSLLALFALALQLGLSFGHTHANVAVAGISASGSQSQATPDATIAIPTLPASAPDSTVVVTTPDGQAKVMAESLQDMAKRLEALAAEQEKAAKK